MRAMRKLLREKLTKKDEAKRLAAMKSDNLIRKKNKVFHSLCIFYSLFVISSGNDKYFV